MYILFSSSIETFLFPTLSDSFEVGREGFLAEKHDLLESISAQQYFDSTILQNYAVIFLWKEIWMKISCSRPEIATRDIEDDTLKLNTAWESLRIPILFFFI